MESGYDLNHLLQEAKSHWLTPDQLLFILQNHHPTMIQHRVHQLPTSGSVFLFNRKNVPSFRRDGHTWRKKPNRNCVNESHEKLKVGNVEALVCYYAKGATNPSLRRRIYWEKKDIVLNREKDIVLVHYLDTAEGNTNSASNLEGSGQSYTVTPSVMHGYQSLGSPLSVEVTSREVARRRDLFPSFSAAQNVGTLPEVDMFSSQMIQELQEQLVQNCNVGEQSSAFDNKKQNIDGTTVIGSDKSVRELDQGLPLQQHGYFGSDHVADLLTWQDIAFLTAPQPENLEACLDGTRIQDSNSMRPDPSQTEIPLRAAEKKFNISEISPQWCFADEVTKVIVIGKFNCDPSESVYAMFGDIQVEAQIMQNGVLCCQAPSNCPGKVSFCITSGSQECCSEVKDFEYRDRNSMEEGKLLVKFVEMLSTDSSLQGLLEDKLQQWLRTRFENADNQSSCTLSKKERGIIHLVAGLGYDWALSNILDSGVSVNFRDTNGWTALHWAARFGREKMVSELIAYGASVSSVTDPTAEDPMGKNAASIAEANGHKGLAVFLSASALTSQFSDLKIEKENISNEFVDEDEACMKRILEASREAAERKEHAFREREAAVAAAAKRGDKDEFGLTCEEAQLVCAATVKKKSEALATVTIQKYYRSWKRRTLAMRNQAAIKIQAHERGRRVRKYYRVIRVVNLMEKIILRWRRKRYGLRDFRLQGEAMEENDEDIFKDFRKKKLDSTVKEAFERVRNLVHCRETWGQCSRMRQALREAKDRLGVSTQAQELLSGIDFGENDGANIDAFGLLPLQDTPASPDYFSFYQGVFNDDMGDRLDTE